jgi:hypothetical protein
MINRSGWFLPALDKILLADLVYCAIPAAYAAAEASLATHKSGRKQAGYFDYTGKIRPTLIWRRAKWQ